ncbi:MAG: 4Fe-4S binding protein [Candidatus Omnitrophica bacterium]|jgi:2-oxoglutarate ferredoxin oxidoreductase subunit delta|nr:4Fe-4S binding protein [Candidatus Omnitrophota bacterium]
MGKITIDRNACKGCGLCAINCPEKLIIIDESMNVRGVHPAKFTETDPEKCKGCKMCAIMCPEVCIEVYK